MKKIVIFIIAMLCFCCISAWAESEDKYYEVETSYPDYDTTQTSGFIYSDSMILSGSTPMSGDLCKASAVISAAVYDSDRIRSVMENMDYSVQRTAGYGTHTIDDCDHVAYVVGKKETEDGKVLEHNGDGSLCSLFGTVFPMRPGFIPFNTENRPRVFSI